MKTNPWGRNLKVVLTGAITPQSNYRLHLVDPTERRAQYADALVAWGAWARRTGAEVWFVENSGADLAAFFSDAGVSDNPLMHSLSVGTPDAEDVARGKGAAEALMMDAFAEHNKASTEGVWVKATGRLFVSNAMDILPPLGAGEGVAARLSLDLQHMDTRFFAATPEFWMNNFQSVSADISEPDGIRIEHVLARRTLQGLGAGGELQRFTDQPRIVGTSGTWKGRNYGGIRSQVKRGVVSLLDRALRGPLANKHF